MVHLLEDIFLLSSRVAEFSSTIAIFSDIALHNDKFIRNANREIYCSGRFMSSNIAVTGNKPVATLKFIGTCQTEVPVFKRDV